MFDADFMRAKRPLESLPGERFHQNLACIQHQIAAICPVEGAGFDAGKIGRQRAHFRNMLDTANQFLISRMVGINHGAAFEMRAVDDEINAVAPERRLGIGEFAGWRLPRHWP